nr:MAG TPA: hypothetical protein [Caudoviricetes sp.]
MQSEIYDCFLEFAVEQVRYALYFAHELGWFAAKQDAATSCFQQVRRSMHNRVASRFFCWVVS